MGDFVSQENIRRYRKLASVSTDSTERSQILKLLAEEQAKLKLETRRRDHARAQRLRAARRRLEDCASGRAGARRRHETFPGCGGRR
jgi:hypothetical protein